MTDFLYISTETDYNIEEEPPDFSKIRWFSVKTKLFETDLERKEKLLAMRKQYDLGIIQANGLPTGITPEQIGLPKEIANQNVANRKIPNTKMAKKFGLRS